MKFRLAVLAVLGVIVIGLGWLFFSNYQYIYEDEPEAPRGQAIYDPLYAASLALKAYGVDTVLRPFLDMQALRPGTDDTLVYYGDLRTLAPDQVLQIYRWVAQGGHLVVRLPQDDQAEEVKLLQMLGLKVARGGGCAQLAVTDLDRKHAVWMCGANSVQGSAAQFRYAAGTGDRQQYVQKDLGRGWVAALSDLQFMTNPALKDPQDEILMLRVLQPTPGKGRVILIYSMDSEGFPILLLRYGWMVLLPLALGLLLLLLRAATRFGPPLPAAQMPRRSLLEHVRATGEMLWRDGDTRALYEAVRADMLLTLRRRHPAASRARSRELLDALTAITGLPRARVRRGLAQDGVDLRDGFTDRIATLIEIRKRL
ncbi:MAG TPA: DUF4350 domain-containing protein [Gammaproteobacteria bacterium]|jgi:hypothetical protein